MSIGYRVYKNIIYVSLLIVLSACVDETLIEQNVNGSFISIKGMEPQSSTHVGSPEDYVIETLRVLTFDTSTGSCITNIRYNTSQNDVIQHPVTAGNYDFVFLANEPATDNFIESRLAAISKYEDLNNIAYPADFFLSDRIIPMIQEMKNVTILTNGQGARLNDGTTVSLLQLALYRLGVRVDVILEAVATESNFDDAFEGVTFSGIPNLVPLTAHYNGSSVKHNITRTFTRDTKYISDMLPTVEGATWAKKITRIILPSNELEEKEDKEKAIVFTINMKDKYNPSTELKIASNPANYSLPNNTKLDLTGIIRESLDVNIEASEWGKTDNQWNIPGNRILNVSHTEVSITDFNGARISFWSNMPVVRVANTVKVVSTGQEMETNTVFNALSSQTWAKNRDERISYDPTTGSGYMDILLDRPNNIGEETYKITLVAAEDYYQNSNQELITVNPLEKTILVHVKQEGTRVDFIVNSDKNRWTRPYIGAFFTDNETGERVISGNRYSYWHVWTATVPEEYRDFIIISTTPSFDPAIGTEAPGEAEDYPVIPNSYKNENGYEVRGRGRIYFRIGLRSKNPHQGTPRYGRVDITYANSENGVSDTLKTKLFVRQGEDADYLMRNGSTGNTYGAKFSPYNLTAKVFKDNPNTTVPWVLINKNDLENSVDFVKYPTQAGAHFQWGLPITQASLALRAYHPTNVNLAADWSMPNWPISYIGSPPLWRPVSGDKFEDYYEICPPGYRRPTDGPVDQIAVNSLTYGNQIYQSDWRMSIFKKPMKGDASSYTVDKPFNEALKTELYTPQILDEIMYGQYADGFFDRRPIKTGKMLNGIDRENGTESLYKGVSLNNANAAYGGVLLFNSETDASIFFPAAGRRWHLDGSLEFASETGYYWSSSVAPGWTQKVIENGVEKETGTPYSNIWSMEFNYPSTMPKSISAHFGYSLRCVKK